MKLVRFHDAARVELRAAVALELADRVEQVRRQRMETAGGQLVVGEVVEVVGVRLARLEPLLALTIRIAERLRLA